MRNNCNDDLFVDDQGDSRVVRGAYIVSGAPRLADVAARVGFDIVWVEMEHGQVSYETAEAMCTAAQASGAAAAIRVSSVQRQYVLRALEVGADVVVAPMVNTVEDATELVRHGKFPPVGNRGYNTRSRGMNYGLGTPLDLMDKANRNTYLIAQVETTEAVKNLDAILAVDGLAGILIGPGDLSNAMGCGGELTNADLVETVTRCIRTARQAGKHAGILAAPSPLLEAAVAAGADLVFFAGDIMDLGKYWPDVLAKVDPKPTKEG